MYKIIKKQGKIVEAYKLGEDNEKESVVFIGRERGQRMRGKY